MTEATTGVDLTAIMRQVWDDTGEADPREAAKEVLGRIPEGLDEAVLLYLLAGAYSSFLTGISREPPLDGGEDDDQDADQPERRKPTRKRRNPAINPAVHRDDVIRDLDERPFYVPSVGRYARVKFRDMTAAYWAEFAEYRRNRAHGYEVSAQWAELNIAKLDEYRAARSGDLPDDVKREIFEDAPTMDE